MNVALNQLGIELVGLLGQSSVELALLTALVLMANHLLPLQSPALRHFIWVLVLLKPVVALAISSPWTLFAPMDSVLQPQFSVLYDVPSFASVEVSNMVAVANVGSASLLTAGWLAAVWIAGVALLLVRILLGYGVMSNLRRHVRVHSTGYLFNVLQQARCALPVNAYINVVSVATSDIIRSPVVMGIFRPLIVLPTDLLGKLRADELELVLMHELAHVRRLDNLTLLLQRLVTAALFFHPAVWLCGRMLQREAEQACDDLVVNATGRSEVYACGLASVAELAHLKSHLKRRIPMMNVFAAAESDLPQRIRRSLHGGASRMHTRSRVLAGLMLFALSAVTLPGAGISQTRDEAVDWWDIANATAPEEWSQELKDQIVAAGYNVVDIAERVRLGQAAGRVRAAGEGDREDPDTDLDAIGLKIREAIERGEITPEEGREKMEAARRLAAGDEGKRGGERVWRAAMATDPDEWSEELKAAILELKPDSTIEDIAEGVRQRQVLARTEQDEKGDRLRDFQRGVIERAMAEAPDEWSDELKVAIERAGWDLQEFAEGVRQRQAAGGEVTDLGQIRIDLNTAVEESSWGQIKKDAIEGK